MASVEVSALSTAEHDQLCCAYAALMLHDDGLEVSAEKLDKVIKASGNTIESYWTGMFAKALEGQDIEKLLTSIASAGPSSGAGAGPAAAAAGDAPKEAEKPKEEEVEADVDMGGMFGDEEY